jgi:hypothetical protein
MSTKHRASPNISLNMWVLSAGLKIGIHPGRGRRKVIEARGRAFIPYYS